MGADGPVASCRVVVQGRVQGVFFRDSCRRLAQQEGVAGWVRNTAGGDVEARFEGPAAGVARLVAWCRQGPPHALVTGVQVAEVPSEGLTGFRVR